MLKQIQMYALISLIAFSVVSGGASYYLWNRNSELKTELKQVNAARERAEANLVLVSNQLADERIIRENAEEALSGLGRVPDVDYNTPLPPSISSVISDFNERMR